MGFKFVKNISGENYPIQRTVATTAATAIPSDAALSLTAGKAVLATGTTKPLYISLGDVPASATPPETPVQGPEESHIYETTFAAAATSINEGDKVTIHSDGLQVTATTTNGVARVVRMFGTALGSKVWVRFD